MYNLKVSITRWTDDYTPGFVEFRFTDRQGAAWVFEAKLPYLVADYNLSVSSDYPQPAAIECAIVKRSKDSDGRKIAAIILSPNLYIMSEHGLNLFEVFETEIVSIPQFGTLDDAKPIE
jgi:hypothetical protein